MKSTVQFRYFSASFFVVLGLALNLYAKQTPAPLQSDSITLVPGSPALNIGEVLPAEVISVQPSGVFPLLIHRPVGRFILVISNTDQSLLTTGVVIDPASVGDLQLGKTSLAKMGSKALSDYKGRSATLFLGLAGSYDVKNASTGKILCKVVIE